MSGALHFIAKLFNKADYLMLGLLVAAFILIVLSPLYRITNSTMGRGVTLLLSGYCYVRWQANVLILPGKSENPTCEDKLDWYVTSRTIYMTFANLILSVACFVVGRLRG